MSVPTRLSWQFMGLLGSKVCWNAIQRDLRPLLEEKEMDRVAHEFQKFLEHGGRTDCPWPAESNQLDP